MRLGFGPRVRRFLAGPGVVIAAIVGGALVLLGIAQALEPVARFVGYSTPGLSSARQGESVEIDGGSLTALRWCAFIGCPEGGHGNAWIWVKACAKEDGWDVDEASFDVFGARGEDVDSVLTPPQDALGLRTLRAGACVEGIAAFSVVEAPTHASYEGHGHRVQWELKGTDQIPLTKAALRRFAADERRWLVQFERFSRRANLGRLLPGETQPYTAQTLRSLTTLGEACARALRAGDPRRFARADKSLGSACRHFQTAGTHFLTALAVAPDAAPIAETTQARQFDKAFDDGFDAFLAGHDTLVRAHDAVLAIISVLPIGGGKKAPTSSGSQTRPPRASPLIAFVSGRDGNDEIYVMNPDGSGVRRLTRDPRNDGVPAWSPDGTRIAFGSDRDGDAEIYVMNADGSGQRRLTRTFAADAEPAWSPEGTKIAFTSDRDGDFEIYVLSADGRRKRLTTRPGLDYGPAWSPDGRQIAFTSDRDGNENVYVMKADGSAVRRLTRNAAADADPAWSPDGSRIAFTSDRDGNPEIYVMDADGSDQRNVTRSPAVDVFAAWSADGTKIVFQSRPDGNRDIYVMNADGTMLRRLTRRPEHDVEPAWQPTGRTSRD